MQLKIQRVIKNWQHSASLLPLLNFSESILNTSGHGRRFVMYPTAPFWSEAFAEFGLYPSEIEPMFQNMATNHYADGAHVHFHRDPVKNGFVHARCNVMLKKPQVGGLPVIDGAVVNVDEGDMWLCLSSLEWHASEPIYCGERATFSFGGLVLIDEILPIT